MSMSAPSSSRPHWAGRWESRFDRGLARSLRHRGWSARVEPYTGYGLAAGAGEGDAGWVRVLARVMLTPAGLSRGVNRQPTDPTALPEDSAPQPRRQIGRAHV